jgi:thioesterase domain-containing protein/acyl carrier protein
LARFVSDYMIPATFCRLDALPITADGKTDRKALPAPQQNRPALPVDYTAPQTSIEEELAKIWAELFKLNKVGTEDNFFDLGGHSLLAGELIVKIRRKLNADLPLTIFFEAPTIARLAARIAFGAREVSSIASHRPNSLVIELQKGFGDKQVFCFPYVGGIHNEFFHFAELARQFGSEYSFYGLCVPGLDEPISRPGRRVEEMAAMWLEEMQKLQPSGPYLLLGECLGGVAAYETARQLTSRGEKVALLAFLDTKAWSWGGYLRRRFLAPVGQRLDDSWTWNYALTRTKFHVGVLRRLNFSHALQYLASKTSSAATLIPYGLRRQEPAITREPPGSDHEVARIRAAQIKRVEDAYFQAFRRYRLRPYSGRISLLVNENAFALNPTLGWEKLAGWGLDIHKLPGDHDACVPENIPLVARILMECLDKAKIQ